MKLAIVNPRKTTSSVTSPCGSIRRRHTQTPNAHHKLISREDLLFITLTISGMFQNGSIIPAIKDIFANIVIFIVIRGKRSPKAKPL